MHTQTISVKLLKAGDKVRMPYGDFEIMTVADAFEALPGRGIKGAGWHVFWTDGNGKLYKKYDMVDVVSG